MHADPLVLRALERRFWPLWRNEVAPLMRRFLLAHGVGSASVTINEKHAEWALLNILCSPEPVSRMMCLSKRLAALVNVAHSIGSLIGNPVVPIGHRASDRALDVYIKELESCFHI